MQDICSRRELFDHSTSWQPKAFVQGKPTKMFTLTLGMYVLFGESSISKMYIYTYLEKFFLHYKMIITIVIMIIQ